MKKILIAMLLLAGLAVAQIGPTSPTNTFSATRQHSPSASAVVVTIQQPAADANSVEPLWLKIYSSVAIVVELEIGGTAATSTAETENGTATGTISNAADVFYDSDVGNGTTIDTYDIEAGETLWVNLTDYNLKLIGAGTTKNYSIRSDSVTGTVRTTLVWREW